MARCFTKNGGNWDRPPRGMVGPREILSIWGAKGLLKRVFNLFKLWENGRIWEGGGTPANLQKMGGEKHRGFREGENPPWGGEEKPLWGPTGVVLSEASKGRGGDKHLLRAKKKVRPRRAERLNKHKTGKHPELGDTQER